MDNASLERLKKVHPELRRRVELLLQNLNNLGFDVRVVQGLRTFEEQNALYAQGRSKPGNRVTNAVGGQSNHNYGFAVDLCPFVSGKPDWNDIAKFNLIGREAMKLGLEWGGDWKFVDKPHVQLRGMSVKECQAFYKTGSLPAVWNRMNQILSGSKPTVFTPKKDDLLEFGDEGAEVTRLQQRLVKLNLLRPHEVDGEFGKITKNAVIGFQRQNHLTADGIVGPVTRKLLLLDLKPEEIKLEIPELAAADVNHQNHRETAISEPMPVSNDSDELNGVGATGSDDSTQNQQLPNPPVEMEEGEKPNQTADNINNINLGGESDKPNVPLDFKPENKTVTAPAKEGSTETATRITIAGYTLPLVVSTVIIAIKSLVTEGFVDAREIGSVVLNLMLNNTKYLFVLIGLIIVGMMLKKLYKQITLWIEMYIKGRGDMNNVEVKKQ